MKQTCRWLMLLGLLCASAGTQAIAMQAEMVADPGPGAGATQKLMRWMNLDEKRAPEVNLYARVIALTSTCVLGAWFVVGGIPKRNRGLTVMPLATSERVKVIDGPGFESRPNTVFLQAFPARVSEDRSWLPGVDDGQAITGDASMVAEESMAKAARGFVQQWIVAGDRDSQGAKDLLLPQDLSAEMRDAAIDHALLAEVEQYARQLLGRSPGLDASSFDQMMAVAMAAVDAARNPVDKNEVILSDQAVIAEEIASIDVPGWVDQDEAILCELWGITPEEAANVEEDVLGLADMVRTPMRMSDVALTELDVDAAAAEPAVRLNAAAEAKVRESGVALYEQRIIILGESEAVLEIEKRIVIAAGARVITFRRWDEALKFADEKDFDLLLINGITEDGWTVGKLHDWMAKNRAGWEKRSAFGLSAPDAEADDFASRTAAWCIVHPFGPKELVSFLQAVLAPRDEQMVM
jgi:hypothetical protein